MKVLTALVQTAGYLLRVLVILWLVGTPLGALALGGWDFSPDDVLKAVILTLICAPILVGYFFLERWVRRKWRAMKERWEARAVDEFRRNEQAFEESLKHERKAVALDEQAIAPPRHS